MGKWATGFLMEGPEVLLVKAAEVSTVTEMEAENLKSGKKCYAESNQSTDCKS